MELKISELIRKYRHKGRSQEKYLVERQLNAYFLARAVLHAPQSRPNELVRRLKKDMGVSRLPFRVVDELDRYHLGPRRRVTWAEQIAEIGECLCQFATGTPADYDFEALYEQAKEYLATQSIEEYARLAPQDARPIEPKAILYAFYTELPDSVSYKGILHDTAKLANFKQSKTLLDELVELVAEERGLRPKKSAPERAPGGIDETRGLPASLTHRETAPRTATAPSLPEDDIPFDLIEDENVMAGEEALHENADLRAALEIAQQRFEVVNEEVKHIREEAKLDATIAFFQEMNSGKHSSLLDQLLKAEGLVKGLKKNGIEIPQEIELIPIIIRMFNRFLKTQGIVPKATVGAKMEITLSDSDEYEYIGSEWEDPGETKTVEVISAGWLYEGALIGTESEPIVINKPKVQEVTS
ncbi:hypothetical protein C6495_14265 [Candidatus Poribacteria bacterium]|nr:MAG: hypothetical protein C6495_14265 [Candidatus Poribacteria bacterium]